MAEERPRRVTDVELFDHMRTMTRFRTTTEKDLERILRIVEALPAMEKEQKLFGVALFAPNDNNDLNIKGVVHQVREMVIGWETTRKNFRALCWVISVVAIALAGPVGFVLHLVWQAIASGVIRVV